MNDATVFITSVVSILLGIALIGLISVLIADKTIGWSAQDQKARDHERRKDELAITISAYDRLSSHEPHSHAAEALRAKIVRLAADDWPPSDDQSRKQRPPPPHLARDEVRFLGGPPDDSIGEQT